jgi:hypothetical protein
VRGWPSCGRPVVGVCERGSEIDYWWVFGGRVRV